MVGGVIAALRFPPRLWRGNEYLAKAGPFRRHGTRVEHRGRQRRVRRGDGRAARDRAYTRPGTHLRVGCRDGTNYRPEFDFEGLAARRSRRHRRLYRRARPSRLGGLTGSTSSASGPTVRCSTRRGRAAPGTPRPPPGSRSAASSPARRPSRRGAEPARHLRPRDRRVRCSTRRGTGSAWHPSPTAWEPLGGVFTSPPAVAAWGPTGSTSSASGPTVRCIHKAWDGQRLASLADRLGAARRRLHQPAGRRSVGAQPARHLRPRHGWPDVSQGVGRAAPGTPRPPPGSRSAASSPARRPS